MAMSEMSEHFCGNQEQGADKAGDRAGQRLGDRRWWLVEKEDSTLVKDRSGAMDKA